MQRISWPERPKAAKSLLGSSDYPSVIKSWSSLKNNSSAATILDGSQKVIEVFEAKNLLKIVVYYFTLQFVN